MLLANSEKMPPSTFFTAMRHSLCKGELQSE